MTLYSFLEGLKRALPICLGYLPVGFAFGVLAVKNGIPALLAVAMSCVQFSGSGQFVFASLWGSGASYIATALAVGIVNLRYLLMSAAEAPWMTGIGKIKRFFLGYGVTDESFVVHATALKNGWKLDTSTMFVCNQTAELAWVTGSAVGAFCGELVDDVRPLGLDYAITAMFIALLIPQCGGRLPLTVAIFTAALSVTLKCCGLGQWNVAIASAVGATLGLCLAGARKKDDANERA